MRKRLWAIVPAALGLLVATATAANAVNGI